MPLHPSKRLASMLANRSELINSHGDKSAVVCRHDVEICLEIKSSRLSNDSVVVAQENGWPFVIDFAELSCRVQGLRDMIRRVIVYSEELERTPVWKSFRAHFPDILKFSRCSDTQAENLRNTRPG
jgi:hypothetical protein